MVHDLTGKSLYLAVRCQNNEDHIIPLKAIEFDAEGISLEVWGDRPPFDVTCDVCKNHQRSFGHQLLVWLGPLPNESFQPNPAFQ